MKTFHWRKQYFKVGDMVSAKNPFDWIVYPKKMKITGIRKNKFGRVSYVVKPAPKHAGSKRPHHWLMLEELVPRCSKIAP